MKIINFALESRRIKVVQQSKQDIYLLGIIIVYYLVNL